MVIKTKPEALSLVAQWVHLQKAFPACQGGVYRNQLESELKLMPSSLSEEYTVKLAYSLEMRPKVRVIQPELLDRDGEIAPHVYSDGTLCLYFPRTQEWDRTMFLADTIVPWTCEWLFFYEIWLGTGEWYGGGLHPPNNQAKDRD